MRGGASTWREEHVEQEALEGGTTCKKNHVEGETRGVGKTWTATQVDGKARGGVLSIADRGYRCTKGQRQLCVYWYSFIAENLSIGICALAILTLIICTLPLSCNWNI